jgi:excisionase family DNA binding protein
LLNADEAAKALGIGTSTLYVLLGRGELPSIRIEGRRLFAPADIERFIAAHREEVLEK